MNYGWRLVGGNIFGRSEGPALTGREISRRIIKGYDSTGNIAASTKAFFIIEQFVDQMKQKKDEIQRKRVSERYCKNSLEVRSICFTG